MKLNKELLARIYELNQLRSLHFNFPIINQLLRVNLRIHLRFKNTLVRIWQVSISCYHQMEI